MPAPPRASRPPKIRVVLAVAGTLAVLVAALVLRNQSTAPKSAGDVVVPSAAVGNAWIAVQPPAGEVRLGLDDSDSPAEKGFRPGARMTAPSYPYRMHQHEVSWGELDPWLAGNRQYDFSRPANAAKTVPAVGVPWTTADAYCRSLGAALPTEEEWEYAARGAQRRPYAWGSDRLDRARTHAYAGSAAAPAPVMTSPQDRTPGDDAYAIFDLIGNAEEWTGSVWRESSSQNSAAWATSEGSEYRPVRGLPLLSDPPLEIPAVGAAYRDSYCAGGACLQRFALLNRSIGFRCVKR
jgi:formylglycine-generating enzyme required for sulfatase activity